MNKPIRIYGRLRKIGDDYKTQNPSRFRREGFETVEKVPTGLFRRTSAPRARFAGNADKPHTCVDRSVFCLGRAEAKNGFQMPTSRAKATFSTS